MIQAGAQEPEATRYIPLHVLREDHLPAGNLQNSDLTLLIDGKPRAFTLVRPWKMPADASGEDIPFLLVLLPPNQPIMHHLILSRLQRYFEQEITDDAGRVRWQLAVVDSDGTSTNFTRDKAELLQLFARLDKKTSPMILAGTSSAAGWTTEEENSIAFMRFLPGRKIVLAVEPQQTSVYSTNTDSTLLHWFPADAVQDARQAGATLFVVNPAGPVNGDGLNSMQTSLMWRTADASGGNFDNSLRVILKEIAGDRDANYLLRYMAEQQDDDHSSVVQVVLRDRTLHAILGTPFSRSVLFSEPAEKPEGSAAVQRLSKASRKAVSQGSLRLAVRADNFPNRSGRYNTVPLSAELQWLGEQAGPREVEVLESLEFSYTGFALAKRHLTVQWNGRKVSWVRVNRLMPGEYIWRVAATDREGEALASAVTRFHVQAIDPAHVTLSSLVLTRGCGARIEAQNTGADFDRLKPRVAGQSLYGEVFEIAGCREQTNPIAEYSVHDPLTAFVRVYLPPKVDKGRLDQWQPEFSLRNTAGAVQAWTVSLVNDSLPGYLAQLQIPAGSLQPGRYALHFALRGPGIHGKVEADTTISVIDETDGRTAEVNTPGTR